MAHTLSDYLDLTDAQATAQWDRIATRPLPPPGKRQEPFLPVETLLCHGLFSVVRPNRYGGKNIHTVPDVVKTLAATFGRTPGSITNKMLNLDGSRKNGARLEVELYARLAQAPTRYVELYRRILVAARVHGLDAELVPDFLGWLDAAAPGLVGQDEIGRTELDIALREQHKVASRLQTVYGLNDAVTEKVIEQRVRQGQDRFARQVLRNFGHQCGFCGLEPGELSLLRASHIKPWRESTSAERLDLTNGIAACAAHDDVFDRVLVTVNGGLRVHRSPQLSQLTKRSMVARDFYDRDMRDRLLLPDRAAQPGGKYLAWHNAAFRTAHPGALPAR